MSIKKSLAAGALALALPMSAMAATDFKINGFANAGFSWTDTDEQYISSDKDGTFNEASFLGLQMRFAPNTDVPISFITQLLARGRNGWNMDADWAFVQWNATEDLAVNVGRVKLPFFLISEAYDVGVTYPWITPPEEIYGFTNVPFTSITGMSVDYNHFFDESWISAKVLVGRDASTVPVLGTDIPIEVKQMVGVALSWGTENLELRASGANVALTANIKDVLSTIPLAIEYQNDIGAAILNATAKITSGNEILSDSATYAAAMGIPEANLIVAMDQQVADGMVALTEATIDAQDAEDIFTAIANETSKAEFYSAGLRYDGDSLFFMTEVARRNMRASAFPDTTSGFATLGYRINKFMPHFTYSMIETENSILVNQSQSSAILGLRYDIEPWAALKFEVQYSEIGDVQIRKTGPLVGTDKQFLPSTGLYNILPDLDDFTGDVPDELIKIQVAYTMVF